MSEMKLNPKRKKRRSRHRSARRAARMLKGLALILVLCAAVRYIQISRTYNEAFMPNTSINGIDVSGMTADQVKTEIASRMNEYTLTLDLRGGGQERISGREISLRPVFDGTVERLLAGQSPLSWGIHVFKDSSHMLDEVVDYDQSKLESVLSALGCMDPVNIKKPADAYLGYTREYGYHIIPEEQGNEPVPETLYQKTGGAVSGLKDRISLEQLDVYKKPEITSDHPALKAQADAWKPYVDVVITYRFGSQTEVLDGTVTHHWLSDDGQGNILIDKDQVREYVKSLAKKYNTAYREKHLKTSYGPTVTITKGYYGWLIHQEAETEAIMDIIYSCKSQDREPVYSQTAASHDGADYGTTYVELNLTAQHLYFYKDGKLLAESDFVSGNEAKGYSTPAGAFQLTYKQRNATLKGKGYATPVSYWMPFNGNIGMHDGYWRSTFGGTIYKKNGSHGCVNLPPSVAKNIYENIEAGVPVLCYHLSGTEQTAASALPAGSSAGTGSTAGAGGKAGTGDTAGNSGSRSTGAGNTEAPKETASSTDPSMPQTEITENPPETPENGKLPPLAGDSTVSPDASQKNSHAPAGSSDSTPETSQAPAGISTPVPETSQAPTGISTPVPETSQAQSGINTPVPETGQSSPDPSPIIQNMPDSVPQMKSAD